MIGCSGKQFKKSIMHFSHKVTLKTMDVGILIQIISLNHLVVLLLMKTRKPVPTKYGEQKPLFPFGYPQFIF